MEEEFWKRLQARKTEDKKSDRKVRSKTEMTEKSYTKSTKAAPVIPRKREPKTYQVVDSKFPITIPSLV